MEVDIFNLDKVGNQNLNFTEKEPVEDTDFKTLTQAQAKILSEASVNLNVDIGSISMSIEDLIDLMPGEVFEFQLEKGKIVKIKLDAKTIAEAKFVKKDGSYALEIVSVFE